MHNLDPNALLKLLESYGYQTFRTQGKNYNLNLIGIRSNDLSPNKFNDLLYVVWVYGGKYHCRVYEITTDPGTYYRENPLNVNGTAILKEGQHPAMWKLGYHRGSYEALVQKSPCTVWRDNDMDDELDFVDGTQDEGMFGINCHRANANRESTQVDKWSAGCQVFADPLEYDDFINLCKNAENNWGNSFTYTLINEKDVSKVKRANT